jgi:hypothetical protein
MFPSRCNQGRKSWTNWYNLGKFRQSTLGNSNWPQFSVLTHTWWATSPSMMDHLPPFSKHQIFQWSEEVSCPGRTHNFIKAFQSWTACKHTRTREKVSKVSTCNNIFQSKVLSRLLRQTLTSLNCLCCHTACTSLQGPLTKKFSTSLQNHLPSFSITQQIGCCLSVTQIPYTPQWILRNVSFKKQKGTK